MNNTVLEDVRKLKEKGLISDFKIKDGWLTVKGVGHKGKDEVKDTISLNIGFEPNEHGFWMKNGKTVGIVSMTGLNFEIHVELS